MHLIVGPEGEKRMNRIKTILVAENFAELKKVTNLGFRSLISSKQDK